MRWRRRIQDCINEFFADIRQPIIYNALDLYTHTVDLHRSVIRLFPRNTNTKRNAKR